MWDLDNRNKKSIAIALKQKEGKGITYKLVGSPIQFAKTQPRPRSHGPELGQHTEEIPEEIPLELGYDWPKITRLKKQRAILQSA